MASSSPPRAGNPLNWFQRGKLGTGLPDMRDPYNVLGIDRTATDEEIKRAYRKLAKELHPDSNPDNAEATERFKEVTAAYELLVDPQRRMEFERGGWRRGYADGFGRGNDDRPWDDGSVFDWSDGSGERPIDLFGDIAGNRRGRVSGAAQHLDVRTG